MVIGPRELHAALTILLLFAIILILPEPEAPVSAPAEIAPNGGVLLDPGHGGPDSGAVASDGTEEAGINLEIARRTQALMAFVGVPAQLTRLDKGSLLYDPAATIRENKVQDMRERLRLARTMPERDFLSIHLNNFSSPRYSGAQVFYSRNHPDSRALARDIQSRLIGLADPANERVIKPAPETVYLMKNLRTPAVIIECGFLSNPSERTKLKTAQYQRLLALSIVTGYLDYKSA